MKYGNIQHSLHQIKGVADINEYANPNVFYSSGKCKIPINSKIGSFAVLAIKLGAYAYYDPINGSYDLNASGTFRFGLIFEEYDPGDPPTDGPGWEIGINGTGTTPDNEEANAEAEYIVQEIHFLFDFRDIPEGKSLYGVYIVEPEDTTKNTFSSYFYYDKSYIIMPPTGKQIYDWMIENP